MQGSAAKLMSKWLWIDIAVQYIAWSVVGMIMEGVWTLCYTGKWQTHVISMIGPFCIIYGAGAVMFYLASAYIHEWSFFVRLLIFGGIGTVFELLCGLILMYGLNMRAWDYTGSFLNYKGLICFWMFFAWGALGLCYDMFIPRLRRALSALYCTPVLVISVIVCIVMVLDLIFTLFCIFKWNARHYGAPVVSGIDKFIAGHFPDDYMQHRFIEWRYLS